MRLVNVLGSTVEFRNYYLHFDFTDKKHCLLLILFFLCIHLKLYCLLFSYVFQLCIALYMCTNPKYFHSFHLTVSRNPRETQVLKLMNKLVELREILDCIKSLSFYWFTELNVSALITDFLRTKTIYFWYPLI